VRTRYVWLGVPLLAALAGCSGMGPQSWDINGHIQLDGPPYALVKITPRVTKVLSGVAPRLVGEFRDRRRPADLRFGIGDVLTVTIFEAGSGGLFIPAEAGVRPGNFVTIPSQAVDNNGNISVPYAGGIRANGRTKSQLQDAIVDALKNRAIEPQVVVSVVTQQTSLITLVGDVRTPGRIPALAAGERILDTISRAGGTAAPGEEEWVMLERGGRRALSPFGALLYEPVNNIWTHPGDTIYLYREPQTFLAFGALGTQRQIPFQAWRISVAEGVAKAGGLVDTSSDPGSVFIYRGETRETVEAMGVDISQFKGPLVPVIYSLNLKDPGGYFLASTMEMRNKDVIYVSNSVSVELAKFRSLLATLYGTATDPMNAAITYYTLKNVQAGTGAVSVIGSGGGNVTTIVNPPTTGP
jgi:polysaccharide export outer membrane protein